MRKTTRISTAKPLLSRLDPRRLRTQQAYNRKLKQLRAEQLRRRALEPNPKRRKLSIIDLAARFRYTDIGRALGVSSAAVAFWFSGRSQPGFIQGMDLARFLDVEPARLEEFLIERIKARHQRALVESMKKEIPQIRASYLE